MAHIVALQKCYSYDDPGLEEKVIQILEASRLPLFSGMKILLKPNLLTSCVLACSNAAITAITAKWLLDHNAKVIIADSPGFGRAQKVANYIGLNPLLKPLGIEVESLSKTKKISLPLFSDRKIYWPVAVKALESDAILSLAKIKAHRQMRITLSVKNCFGCVPGLAKARIHYLYGEERSFFADCQAALWASLPPVWGLLDGIIAMSKSGPVNGEAYTLGLIAASASAPALDAAVLELLKLDNKKVPLSEAINRRFLEGEKKADAEAIFSLLNPDDFDPEDFKLPEALSSTSFKPLRMFKSCVKRIWKSCIN